VGKWCEDGRCKRRRGWFLALALPSELLLSALSAASGVMRMRSTPHALVSIPGERQERPSWLAFCLLQEVSVWKCGFSKDPHHHEQPSEPPRITMARGVVKRGKIAAFIRIRRRLESFPLPLVQESTFDGGGGAWKGVLPEAAGSCSPYRSRTMSTAMRSTQSKSRRWRWFFLPPLRPSSRHRGNSLQGSFSCWHFASG
jgi:hypothetical protein